MLLEEFLKPLDISQSAFAIQLGVSFPRLNEVISARRSITPDTALRLAQVTGMSADFNMFTGARVGDPMPAVITKPSKLRGTLREGFWWVVFALGVLAAVSSFTGLGTSAERTLYFKLPIEGVEFHWVFLDSAAFLSGELTLRILNKDRDDTLVVFRDGKIQDGWEIIGDDKPRKGVYFGFATTTRRFRTEADDSLIITLKATKDLLGRGPFTEGVLAAGVWQMSGSYSSIYGGRWNPMDLIVLHGDPPMAFMECWTGVWPITITKWEGWMGAPSGDDSTFRKLIKPSGTNGRPCGSHI